MPVNRGAYGSVDGVRDAARNRKAAREKVKAAAEANSYLSDAAFAAAMAAIPTPDGFEPEPDQVVAGRFGGTLKRQKRQPTAASTDEIPPEYMKNHRDYLAAKEAERKSKLA